jgi:hypothetical protein
MGLQKVKYKKPRKINPISVSVFSVLALLGFLAYQYVPLSLKSGEATRVLDEAASKYAGQPGRYRAEPKETERLRKQMRNDLQLVGVWDPDMEVWIEADSDYSVRFGCLYSEWIEWPFDIIERQEKIYELEYVLELKK